MNNRHRSMCHLLLAVLAGLTPTVLGSDQAARIAEVVGSFNEVGLFDGAVLVAEGEQVAYEGGVGLANVEWEIPNGPDTRFRIGSITKQFTSMLVMQLVEEGKIELDAPMSTYLPEYRRDVGEQVTVHHLLTHTSGIPSYTGIPGFMRNQTREPWEPGPFVAKYCSGDLEFEPGSTFRYNNSGYFLLGTIIEQVTGKPYETVLRERILGPLGMDDTGYDDHAEIIRRRASGYERQIDGVVNCAYLDMSIPYAAGSMYSTVRDLHLWDRALTTEKLLPESARDRMFEPFLGNYAYGWRVVDQPIGDDETTRVITHGGGINGFNTLIVRFVDEETLVVLFSNHGSAPLSAMARQIHRVMRGEDYERPVAPLDRTLVRTLLDDGMDAALAYYAERQSAPLVNPARLEGQINQAGYQLLAQDRAADAIAVFKLNVRLFPEAFNAWDSLGEALMNNGEREAAIEHYEKSLELNPENANAEAMLKTLRTTLRPTLKTPPAAPAGR